MIHDLAVAPQDNKQPPELQDIYTTQEGHFGLTGDLSSLETA